MSELTTAPEGGAEAIPAAFAPAITEPMNSIDAAKAISRQREELTKKLVEPPAEKPVEPPKTLAEKPNSDPPEEAPAATTEEAEPDSPPIEPPRSWTKEEKEEFATYPREAQEKIARREQDRETALRRSQNEAADKLKGLTAKEEQAERVRQQYESAIPALLQTLQDQQQGEFKDIQTMADVERLAREDWPRYALWDAQQKKIAAISSEVKAAQDRQANDYKTKYADFSSKEDAKALDSITELAPDKAKQTQVAETVLAMVEKGGISREEFVRAWNGEASLPIRHSAMQTIMAKAALYDLAKANVAKPAPKPVPQVQRPGTAPQKGAAQASQIEAAREKLKSAKGNAAVEAGYELLRAKRAASR